jgi:ABC-type bacteriocin/lantibiotic exporter with double-glycine peptidase domain
MNRLPAIRQMTPYSCGPARVRALIQYWEGIDIPERELREALNTQKPEKSPNGNSGGTYPRDIIRFFRRRGYKVREKHGWTERSLKYYLLRKIPILVCLCDHYYLVSGMTETHIVFLDSDAHVMEIIEFMRQWHDKDMDGIPYGRYGIVVRKGR